MVAGRLIGCPDPSMAVDKGIDGGENSPPVSLTTTKLGSVFGGAENATAPS